MKVSEYFNPDQHLTFHQDKEGNMIGGGYQVNSLLYQHKTPLFVSIGESGGQSMTGGPDLVLVMDVLMNQKIDTLFLKSSVIYFVI